MEGVDKHPVSSSAVLAVAPSTGQSALRVGSYGGVVDQRVAAIALLSVFDTKHGKAGAEVTAALYRHCIGACGLVVQCFSPGLGIACLECIALVRLHDLKWWRSPVSVEFGTVGEKRHQRSVSRYAVASATLSRVACALVVAVRIGTKRIRDAVAAPALGVVLCASKYVSSSSTGADAFSVGVVRVVGVYLNAQLTTGSLVISASYVAVLRRAVGEQRTNLLTDSVACEVET